MKKTGTLEKKIETLTELAVTKMESMYEIRKRSHLPQDQSPEELSTTEYENQTFAMEMTEQDIMELIMSM